MSNGVGFSGDWGVMFNGTVNARCTCTTVPDYAYSTSTIEYVSRFYNITDSILFMQKLNTDVMAAYYGGYLYSVNNGRKYKMTPATTPFVFSSTNNRAWYNKTELTTYGNDSWDCPTSTVLGGRGNTNSFYGVIFQIRIYNRQLSEEEILYNQESDIINYSIPL